MRDITVIADLGSNWLTEDDILSAIPAVKEAGADIFKLQFYTRKRLYGVTFQPEPLGTFDVEKVAMACQNCGIELMVSVFNEKDVAYIDRYVMRHKIAAAEASHPVLIEAVIATGKPIVVSVGCIDAQTLAKAVKMLPMERTTFLYCCSEYPARSVNLGHIIDISAVTGTDVGYSDHALDIWQTALTAVQKYGVKMIEKHVYHAKVNSPDMAHSISTAELRQFCSAVRGEYPCDPLPTKWFVRRPIATQHIDPWQKLEYGKNWGFYRPQEDNNNPPVDNFDFMAVYRANTMISQHEIKAGQPIYPHNLRLVPRG